MKLGISRALVVEGRYDAARLANLVEGTILTTDGFAIFRDRARQELFRRTARAQGLVILTDSDAAGFRIRHFVADLVGAAYVCHAFIPALPGKEPRKAQPGREGLLGGGRRARRTDCEGAANCAGQRTGMGRPAARPPDYLHRSV